jgi:hypothetical protein
VGVGVGVNVAVGVGVNVAVAVGVGGGVVAVAVAVGVGVGAPKMFMHCENSEVSIGLPAPSSLVAVAVVQSSPVGSGKLTGPKPPLQFVSVVTTVEPRKCCPWPNPDGSHCPLEKNSRRNMVPETLSSDPDKITFPLLNDADVMTG